MNLKEALLVEGKKYENYFKEKHEGKYASFFKRFASDVNDLRRYIMASDPTADPTNTGNYTDWAIKQMASENNRMGGAAKDWMLYRAVDIKNILKYYDENKKSFKYQDINKYNIKSLEEEKNSLEDTKATRKIRGAKTAFEHKEWKTVEVKNHQMACNIGKGSKWCITARDYPEQFYKYKKFGPIFFVVKGNRRWAVTGGVHKYDTVYNVWDEKDKVIDSKKWREDNSVPRDVHLYLIKRYHKEAPEWGDGE